MSVQTTSPLALHGGAPVRDESKKWPKWPVFDDTERKALNEVLESGEWWYGKRVAKFEQDFAAYQGAKHCITCTSGTTAAEVAMRALGIGHGDEVIVPPYTFIATASSVGCVGATPIFVDIDDSWCMNPALIEAAITPRTKAIMPVHFGGRIADMDAINAIAKKHGLKVVEDACHSWGAKWKGKGTATLGDCGVFSFQASKNLHAAEGGAILTNNDELAAMCRSIVNCGRVPEGAWYHHPNLGTNSRLTEFAGALLSAQLTRLEEHNEIRSRNAALIDRELPSVEGLILQNEDERITRRVYHLYCLRVDEETFGCSRAKLIEAAKAEGINFFPGYAVPLYKQPAFTEGPFNHDYSKDHCPVTEDFCYRSAFLLHHTALLGSEADTRDIVAALEKIKANAAALAE